MAATTTVAPGDASSPWLYGRAVDLLCGYGLLYVFTLIPLGVFAQQHGILDWPTGLGAMIAMALSTPHYGATLLRVYDQKQDRRKYAFFAVWVTLFMLLAFGAAVFDPAVGSILLTLYVFWSPWHFAGQNFGLGMMSLRRRGIAVDPLGRRLLYASFVLSSAAAIVAINGAGFAFAQGIGDGAVFTVLRLDLARSQSIPLLGVVAGAYGVVTLFALARLARTARISDLVPTVLLLATHALWFILPSLSMTTRMFFLPPLVFTPIWISAAHSLQYLWVTSYYAQRSDSPMSAGPFFVKSMLAGSVIVVLPPLLFSPGLIGPDSLLMPTAIGVLTFSVVNLHHFILDGAIWKLRDGRVARALLGRSTAESEPGGGGERRTGFVRPLVYTLGVVGVMFPPYLIADALWSTKSGSTARIEGTAERFGWLGRDSAFVYSALAQQRQIDGDITGAIDAYRRVATLEPARTFEAERLTGLLIETANGDAGTLQEAVAVAEAASRATRHSDPRALLTLGIALEAVGDGDRARQALVRALELARARGDSAVAYESDAHLRHLEPGG